MKIRISWSICPLVNRVLDNLRGSSFIQSVCFVNREREMALSMGLQPVIP